MFGVTLAAGRTPAAFQWLGLTEMDEPMHPGFLDSPQVIAWLDGVEPAWTLLDFDSYCRIHSDDAWTRGAITMVADLDPAEFAGSAVAANAMLLLRRADEAGGLKLTVTGNLTRAVVAEMCRAMVWPGVDLEDLFRFSKVVNEPDFFPLHMLRLLMVEAKLLRKHKGMLVPGKASRAILRDGTVGELQALLFETAFRRVNLSYFDGLPLDGWPQTHIGVVLWSLSAAATAWTEVGRLMRMCAIPVVGVLEAQWDFPASTFEARALRPLHWFGLLERQEPESPVPGSFVRPLYRKTLLFDRFLRFDVTLEEVGGARH